MSWNEPGNEPGNEPPKKNTALIFGIGGFLMIFIFVGSLFTLAINNDKEREKEVEQGLKTGEIVMGRHGNVTRKFEKWQLDDGTVCYNFEGDGRTLGCVK